MGSDEAQRDEEAALRRRVAELEEIAEARARAASAAERENEELRARLAEMSDKQELVQGILDAIPSIIFVKDLRGRLVLANKAFAEFFRAAEVHLVGKMSEDVFPEHVARALNDADRATLGASSPIYTEDDLPRDGELRTYVTCRFPIRDARGEVHALGGFATDITDRRRAQRELTRINAELAQQAAELRTYYALVENAPDGIGVVALDGAHRYANPAYREMTGYGDALVGMRLSELMEEVIPGGGLPELLEDGYWQGVTPCRRREGGSFQAECTLFTIPGERGAPQALGVVVRDITAELAAEAERHELQARIIETQRAVMRDMSTPLIPLSSEVVLLPLIGTIDSQRAMQAMETLLQGIEQHGAAVTILDVTGVPMIDTQVAAALIRAAKAARLLGAKVVITGIRPRIAQTLVAMGIDLGGVVTLGTLQAGIAYAIRS